MRMCVVKVAQSFRLYHGFPDYTTHSHDWDKKFMPLAIFKMKKTGKGYRYMHSLS